VGVAPAGIEKKIRQRGAIRSAVRLNFTGETPLSRSWLSRDSDGDPNTAGFDHELSSV
jgi:hypothetical protein